MSPAARRPPVLYLLVGGALLLLPALAILQYRWIGQVSDAERDRRERTLKHATTQVAQDLDLELVRAFVGLQVDGDSHRNDNWEGYADRVEAWRAAAVSPAIVREVLLADRSGGSLRLRRWNGASLQFVPAEWTEDLGAYRARFARELVEWEQNPPRDPVRPPDLLAEGEDALIVPIAPVRRRVGEHTTVFRPIFGYTIVRLDSAFIREEFLPALVERHFRQGTGENYLVAVVSRRDPSRVLFASNVDNVPDLLKRHDAAADLFGLRPDQFALIRAAAGSLRGSGSPQGDRRRSLFFSFNRRGPGDRQGADAHALEDLLRWKLVARHSAGSLEAAVGAARTRNLLLSFGILLLMATSVAVLARNARRAERLARQQIEFVAAVSHELRTPVSVIGAAAENLSDGLVTDPSRVKQYGARIQREARRLGDTVERVLLYAGIEAGRAVGHRAPVEVGTLVSEALAASQTVVADAGVTVETEVPAGLPPVMVDLTALRSCLGNLILNAIKYGGTNHWVRISASAVAGRREPEVRIAVTDRGLGITTTDLPHIFEPFYRGAEAQALQIQGNGLGLSIVKGIVEAHGGRVTVQSAHGNGSTFILHLPAYKGEPAPAGTVIGHVGAPARTS